MTNDLQPLSSVPSPLPIPWRDPQTVSPAELDGYIARLESACAENPSSAPLRTCLGMAQAMKLDVYKAMDSLETATRLDQESFWAQLKFAELHYRLRALIRAEKETLKALDLASNSWEASVARKQLSEIRALMRAGTQKPEWNKPLTQPAIVLVAMLIVIGAAYLWR